MAHGVVVPEERRRWLLEQLEASPLTVEQFAARHDVSRTSLYRWRHERGRSANAERGVTLMEVVPAEAAAPAPDPSAAVRLVLGGGVELHLGDLPSPRWCAELAAWLRQC